MLCLLQSVSKLVLSSASHFSPGQLSFFMLLRLFGFGTELFSCYVLYPRVVCTGPLSELKTYLDCNRKHFVYGHVILRA